MAGVKILEINLFTKKLMMRLLDIDTKYTLQFRKKWILRSSRRMIKIDVY